MGEQVEVNRALQREAYGEPLADAFRRSMEAFGLTQAGLAGVLGMSPPMLSQLMNAQRVKIGNPAVLSRLQALGELAASVRGGDVAEEQVPALLEEIKASTGRWTSTGTHAAQPVGPTADEAVVEGVRALLRAVASGQELRAAAEVLEEGHPGLAEVLRVYGLGQPDAAAEHFARHRDLF